jgi:hypothetical protein
MMSFGCNQINRIPRPCVDGAWGLGLRVRRQGSPPADSPPGVKPLTQLWILERWLRLLILLWACHFFLSHRHARLRRPFGCRRGGAPAGPCAPASLLWLLVSGFSFDALPLFPAAVWFLAKARKARKPLAKEACAKKKEKNVTSSKTRPACPLTL